jgi:xanthine dehydrogenase accessory factor
MVCYDGGRFEGSLGRVGLKRSVLRDAAGVLAAGRSALRCYGPAGEARSDEVVVFLEAFASPPEMVIFGGVDFTAALSRAAKFLGYNVTVCVARATFATSARFPAADSVVVDWPNRYLEHVGESLGPRDSYCVLTHDPKFDVPVIVAALSTNVGYIGAMGSRKTNESRREKLTSAGVSEEMLERVMAPIGSRPRRGDARGNRDRNLCRDHRQAQLPDADVDTREHEPDPRNSCSRRPTGRVKSLPSSSPREAGGDSPDLRTSCSTHFQGRSHGASALEAARPPNAMSVPSSWALWTLHGGEYRRLDSSDDMRSANGSHP